MPSGFEHNLLTLKYHKIRIIILPLVKYLFCACACNLLTLRYNLLRVIIIERTVRNLKLNSNSDRNIIQFHNCFFFISSLVPIDIIIYILKISIKLNNYLCRVHMNSTRQWFSTCESKTVF